MITAKLHRVSFRSFCIHDPTAPMKHTRVTAAVPIAFILMNAVIAGEVPQIISHASGTGISSIWFILMNVDMPVWFSLMITQLR
jgi:hypothetical protein